MNWRLLQRRDFVAILLAIAVLGVVFFGYVKASSSDRKSNWGFGPEWTCTNPGDGERVCVKKTTGNAN
jgi:hypothetical protein